MWKIVHDRQKCIGCGTCVSVCPSNWKMEKDGKASPKKTNLEEISCNKDAAAACPEGIIKIINIKDGKAKK